MTKNKIPMDSYLLIIGSMKCGTSSLFEYLKQHPAICASKEKEPEYFSNHTVDEANFQKYNKLWDYVPEYHRYAMEGSTGYTKYPAFPNVAQRLHGMGMKPKMIYLVRNPFKQVESIYNHLINRDPNLTKSMTDEHFLNVANHIDQIHIYTECFPRESLLLLKFEELVTDPKSIMKKCYDFLELDHDHYPKSFETFNPVQSGLEKKLDDGLRKIGIIKLIHNIPVSVKNPIKRTLGKVSTKKKPATMTDTEKEIVHKKLQPKVKQLQEEYGVDVSDWGF